MEFYAKRASTAGNNISLFADCDRLIVLRGVSPEQAEIVYDGPGAPVWAAAGKMQKKTVSARSL